MSQTTECFAGVPQNTEYFASTNVPVPAQPQNQSTAERCDESVLQNNQEEADERDQKRRRILCSVHVLEIFRERPPRNESEHTFVQSTPMVKTLARKYSIEDRNVRDIWNRRCYSKVTRSEWTLQEVASDPLARSTLDEKTLASITPAMTRKAGRPAGSKDSVQRSRKYTSIGPKKSNENYQQDVQQWDASSDVCSEERSGEMIKAPAGSGETPFSHGEEWKDWAQSNSTFTFGQKSSLSLYAFPTFDSFSYCFNPDPGMFSFLDERAASRRKLRAQESSGIARRTKA